MAVEPIEWLGDKVRILDQTRLPLEEVYLETDDYLEMSSAIRELKVRGAPTIGVAGGYAIALGSLKIQAESPEDFLKEYRTVSEIIAGTRPTARNLFFAVERMDTMAESGGTVDDLKKKLVDEAVKIHSQQCSCKKSKTAFN